MEKCVPDWVTENVCVVVKALKVFGNMLLGKDRDKRLRTRLNRVWGGRRGTAGRPESTQMVM